MTQQITTISTSEGPVKIDQELVQAYLKEAFEHLAVIEKAKSDGKKAKELLKMTVDTLAETTGLNNKVAAKYAKQRFDATTKETKELGELFQNLDDILLD